MSELPTHFVAQEPTTPDSASETLANPKLLQARVAAQTIHRFQALNQEIVKISDLKQQEVARAKLDVLALKEYGRAWEVLKKPGVEVVPLTIGGKTKDELKQELTTNGYIIFKNAEQIMDSSDFATLPQSEPLELIRLTVADLGFPDYATTAELYAKAVELGLELCPAEVGPWHLLCAPHQPRGDFNCSVGMQPVNTNTTGFRKIPYVFRVAHSNGKRSLDDNFAWSDLQHASDHQFLFRLPLIHREPTEAAHE